MPRHTDLTRKHAQVIYEAAFGVMKKRRTNHCMLTNAHTVKRYGITLEELDAANEYIPLNSGMGLKRFEHYTLYRLPSQVVKKAIRADRVKA